MNPSDIDNAPKVSLGGKDWPVPKLAIKQNRIIDPLIIRILPVFKLWQTDQEAAVLQMCEKEYDNLITVCLEAVRRAAPALTKDEFMELQITLPEMIAAFPVIAKQTGLIKEAKPGEA
jgi:hypothetical protein